MKSYYKFAIAFCILLLSMISFAQEQRPQETYVENEFIIWLEQGVDASAFAIQSNAGIEPKRLLSKRLNIWLFEIVDKAEARDAKMDRLSQNPNVRIVQNNHTNISMREVIPNDPSYSLQWAPGVMQLPQAWEEFSTGGVTSTGETIVVAVIDGGAYLQHEDLSFWKNTHEIPNNGIDDDGNGYIDDYDGWNAYNHNGNIPSHDHGTHVMGIVGAIGNNEKGVCGVNWNVKIMPIAGSSSNESVVVEAYAYALEMRARYNETDGAEGSFVVATNSSFGVDYGHPEDFPIWCSMFDELGSVGIMNCVAGPNLDINVDQQGDVPSTCPGDYLIGITNTTMADIKYPLAGFGIHSIDIGAPGTRIYSTVPYDKYENSTGTSMATPQVSGTIALMYAAMSQEMIQSCKDDPAAFCISVKQAVLNGADHLSSLDGLVASGRRLNAYGAIESFLANAAPSVLSGEVGIIGDPVFGRTLNAEANLSSTPPVSQLGVLSYQWQRNSTDIVGASQSFYTLTKSDIGQLISVRVSADNCSGMVVSSPVGPIRKATQTMPDAPRMESRTEKSITLVAVTDCEYNINNGLWQDSPVFDNLKPRTSYVFTQRKKETSTHYASPVSPEAAFLTSSTQTNETEMPKTICIYPNPAKGSFTVEGTGLLFVTNLLGQEILVKEIDGHAILELPKGMYFLRLNGATQKVVVE